MKQLDQLLKVLQLAGVSEFDYKDDKYRLRLVMGRASSAGPAAMPEALASPGQGGAGSGAPTSDREDAGIVFVTSPFVGTFHTAASPEAQPFVSVGARVSKGQPLCIVEAMKLMNEIETEVSGTVLEILVENGANVEYGQRLFKLQTV